EEIIKEFIKINNEFFSVTQELKETLQHINTKPAFAGILLGRQKGQQFQPSLYLLQKLADTSNKKITVDEKCAWMFICGKDIFGKSIVKTHKTLEINEFVLVQNVHGECLGYGKIINELSNKRVAVQNIFDIGNFLRRERA
ncbi:hypothetical protein HY484_00900, partial [Candidatus Woesearchaeota archaeon]|nr:hypothetical protein [Candidatus Woesearchaeota archaeon]